MVQGGRIVTSGSHDQTDPSLRITGTWTLDRPLNQWTRVFVHIPSFAAWNPQALYTIDYGTGVQTRMVNQHRFANEWVPLGVFQVSGTPTISLSNAPLTSTDPPYRSDGFYDIAWDAVAFQPLAAKPHDFVVALGDSYSSGEGAATNTATGVEYSSETDHDGTTAGMRGACHRSSLA